MKRLLLGNEAVAWGALNAGVRIAAAYPGTPSTEIGETFAKEGKKYGLYFEWSVNEKVALEVATGGSYHGLRSMASMKNLGLNVASDVLNVINFNGVGGGLVIVSADDPQAHSSTNEQDGRWHALMSTIPLFEPSDVQEAYDLTKAAFDISEKFSLPVMIRTVTRLAHARGVVDVEDPSITNTEGKFLPHQSYRLSGKIWDKVEGAKRLHATINLVKEYFCNSFNVIEEQDSELGIICCGISYQYTKEALKLLNLSERISLFKLVTPYPIPERLIQIFCQNKKRILVLEELSPFAEIQIRPLGKNVFGKKEGLVPLEGELNPDIIVGAIANLENIKLYENEERKEILSEASRMLVHRTLTLCPGCAYRDVWYVLARLGIPEVFFSGDIGCYTLLTFLPHRLFDTVFAMGSSVGIACGGYHSNSKEIQVALMGDSTFFHSGITGLINAIYNRARLLLIVLDNETTAMTGFEPHPGTGMTASGEKTKRIWVEDIAKGCDADWIEIIHPFHMKKFEIAVKKALEREGVSVIVTRHPCILYETLQKRKKREKVRTYYVSEKCRGCGVCGNYRCPAIFFDGDTPRIVEEACMGCGVCDYICPFFAISARDNNE